VAAEQPGKKHFAGFAGPFNNGNAIVGNAGLPPPGAVGHAQYGSGAQQNIAFVRDSSSDEDELDAAANKDIPQSFGLINAFMLSRQNTTKGGQTPNGTARVGTSVASIEGFQRAPLTVEGGGEHTQNNGNGNGNHAPAAHIHQGPFNGNFGGNYQRPPPQKQAPKRRPPPPSQQQAPGSPGLERVISPDDGMMESMYNNDDPILELSKVTSQDAQEHPSNVEWNW